MASRQRGRLARSPSGWSGWKSGSAQSRLSFGLSGSPSSSFIACSRGLVAIQSNSVAASWRPTETGLVTP
ncbi:hypothetical protein RDMS_12815 [Deinococcus sp. RL]|nr:hypothetical protein RDMS_12815 [Deinococcus sp. RL]